MSQETIVECPRCGKEIALKLDILHDLVIVSQEPEEYGVIDGNEDWLEEKKKLGDM